MQFRRLATLGLLLLTFAAICDARLISHHSAGLSVAALVLSLAALALFTTRDIYDRM
jgi:hypothetical protein